jgi:hypothetical protein
MAAEEESGQKLAQKKVLRGLNRLEKDQKTAKTARYRTSTRGKDLEVCLFITEL